MVQTVNPLLMDFFQNVNDPMLILNTSCQIESINDQAAQLLNINFTQKYSLELESKSKSDWASFLKRIRKKAFGSCILNIKYNDTYRKIKVMGYYHTKKKLVFARIELAEKSIQNKEVNQIYSVLNHFSHGIILSNLNGEIVEINDIALNYIQCARAQIINQSKDLIFELFNDYQYNKLKYFTDLINNGQSSIELVRKDEDGIEMYFLAESKYNSSMNLIITTITDETERVTLKRLLEQQSSLSTIGQVTASIAHEIRNPMTSLKGFVDLLKINSNDDATRYLNVMDSELQRMESILTEILYLSKPREFYFDQISIYEIVKEVIEIMQPQACSYNVMLQLKIEQDDIYMSNVIGNVNRMKQLLINLIKNAIEVMPSGGTVTINIKQIFNQYIELSVRDEGIGIPAEELNRLFTPFYTTKANGTGLGLALVKKVIEEHNGIIKVESTVGKGTAFIIQLPHMEGNHLFYKNEKVLDHWLNSNGNSRVPIV